mmetsp:Transcript_48895/g.148788  ORF Transcript_48895/g.148788 Transcript_48895/m.148788 type:complete len:412 (-) Transcript_48895:4653-5888(-)
MDGIRRVVQPEESASQGRRDHHACRRVLRAAAGGAGHGRRASQQQRRLGPVPGLHDQRGRLHLEGPDCRPDRREGRVGGGRRQLPALPGGYVQRPLRAAHVVVHPFRPRRHWRGRGLPNHVASRLQVHLARTWPGKPLGARGRPAGVRRRGAPGPGCARRRHREPRLVCGRPNVHLHAPAPLRRRLPRLLVDGEDHSEQLEHGAAAKQPAEHVDLQGQRPRVMRPEQLHQAGRGPGVQLPVLPGPDVPVHERRAREDHAVLDPAHQLRVAWRPRHSPGLADILRDRAGGERRRRDPREEPRGVRFHGPHVPGVGLSGFVLRNARQPDRRHLAAADRPDLENLPLRDPRRHGPRLDGDLPGDPHPLARHLNGRSLLWLHGESEQPRRCHSLGSQRLEDIHGGLGRVRGRWHA